MNTRNLSSINKATMPKRQALNQLTQENWDEQEEREVPGTFKKLPEENLSNRVIKQARRRGVNLQGNTMQSNSPFATFKGFSNKGEAKTSENGDVKPSQHGNGSVLAKQSSSLPKSENSAVQQKSDSCRDLEYYRLLKCLNESLVSWVTQHLTKNPLCDFTPVFSDYKRHLEDLEVRFPIREDDNSVAVDNLKENSSTVSLPQSSKPFGSSVPTAEKSGSSGITTKITSENKTLNSSGATLFGTPKESILPAQNILSASPLFSITKPVVAASSTAVAATGFQFGNIKCTSSKSSLNTNLVTDGGKADTNIFTIPIVSKASTVEAKPFSFSSSIVQSNERKEDKEESEDDMEPPKNEFIPVVEKDAVYSKRCKLFYNKDGNYVEKGIGTLYLKPLNEKMQLLVRANTSLGNILLNILLTSSLPVVKRVGKNNVLIVCIPNPPIDPTKQQDAVPMLIRVKTENDANELLKQIEESKSS